MHHHVPPCSLYIAHNDSSLFIAWGQSLMNEQGRHHQSVLFIVQDDIISLFKACCQHWSIWSTHHQSINSKYHRSIYRTLRHHRSIYSKHWHHWLVFLIPLVTPSLRRSPCRCREVAGKRVRWRRHPPLVRRQGGAAGATGGRRRRCQKLLLHLTE